MAKKDKKKSDERIIARNKRARFEYDIVEDFEAGIVLTGTEVKSLRESRGNISDAYARIEDGEVFLLNAHITPYSHAHFDNHAPERKRKLLLHHREIKKLYGRIQERGMTLVAMALYFNERGFIKVRLGLAKGKRKQTHDKRLEFRERMADREVERAAGKFD